MKTLPTHVRVYESYTYGDDCPLSKEKDGITVAVEKQSRYQRRIAEMMAQEQAEVDRRLADFRQARPSPSPATAAVEPFFAPEHKLVFFPMSEDKDGRPLMSRRGPFVRLIPIGFRIMLDASGGWWFYSLKARSWTKHMPPYANRYRSLTPVTDSKGNVEMVAGGTVNYKNLADLARRLKHCPKAVIALISQQAKCEEELADRLSDGPIVIYPSRKEDSP